ncbi:permease prefix domain 1-containing protein [Wenzhouxiangella limi]|uniref:DUF4153 domain-containing protein n=1 Tax=Wenzhouxiangella limi TaxID=2707351 RepID=A0A845V3D0_9GAMM|nr:permease prefix domain 1-containing protein [Wenzhouxiangella limi]NDY96780.1 hypothetical protein [Wenzhouxiangella limi]
MHDPAFASALEDQIDQWRAFLRRRQTIHASDINELEDHLREQIDGLAEAGLDREEAFLVAVKRMGSLDALSLEFAREHSDRLWKQLVMAPADPAAPQPGLQTDGLAAVLFAVAAAVAIKLPALFGMDLETHASFYARNIGFLLLPILVAYFAWKRGSQTMPLRWLAAGFVLAAIVANAWPLTPGGSTELLVIAHLPVALWLLVGVAYAGQRWDEVAGRMDFIRFSGELFIYYVLIALGGGVLTAFTVGMFSAIGFDIEPLVATWLLPCGAMGAVVIGAWLVEAKQSVVENMAPVLTRIFTPLFAAMLVLFLVTLLLSGRGIDVEREVLIAFDLLLIVVLGLLLYSVSAREPSTPPGLFDLLQVILIASALLADLVALWAIAARIGDMGLTPNRLAGLGLNLVLLVNLAGSAWLYLKFLRGQGGFARLERWQTDYLPVYAAWAAVVVVLFPPFFEFI